MASSANPVTDAGRVLTPSAPVTALLTTISSTAPHLPNEDKLATTVLVNNIHCASCVTHIKSLLQDLEPPLLDVSVSVVSLEVHIIHTFSTTVTNICEALLAAAFEVNSAFSLDHSGNTVSKLDFTPSQDGWLGAAIDMWRHSRKAQTDLEKGSLFLQGLPRSKRKRHVENCMACQAEEHGENKEKMTMNFGGTREGKSGSSSAYDEKDSPLDSESNIHVKEEPSGLISAGTQPRQKTFMRSEPPGDEAPRLAAQSLNDSYVLTVSIGGMTCASCTNAITSSVRELEYVESVNVDLMTNSATIRYTGMETLSKDIIETIEDIGYEASLVSNESTSAKNVGNQPSTASLALHEATLSIGGMTCVSCSNAITDGIKELSFVKTVNITLMSNSGNVIFEGKQHIEDIVERVKDLGYDCFVESSKQKDTEHTESDQFKNQARTVQLQVNGMYCDHCPPRVIEALISRFADSITIKKTPNMRNPVLEVMYKPNTPDFTIREIVKTIDDASEAFQAQIYHPPSIEERSRAMQIHERNRLFRRLLISGVIAIPTLLIGVVWMSLVPSSNNIRMFFETSVWAGDVTRAEWALFIMSTPVMLFAADVFHVRAIKEIKALWSRKSKTPILRRLYRFGSMNLLISAGTSVAYIASLALLIIGALTLNGNPDTTTYFDAVVFLTFFILCGRYLEAYSKSKTGDAVTMLGKLRPQEAILVVPSSSKISSNKDLDKKAESLQPTKSQRISTDLLEIGDRVIVPHGGSPPADAIIVKGFAQLDESSLTGESRVVKKEIGDTVFVGTINTGNPITVKVTEIGGTSMLDQIVKVVREGQTKPAPVERIADILTGYFVPVITALAIITFLVWFSLGQSGKLSPTYLGGQAGGWAFWSLEFAIAVFVVACPCGIGLAAPTALFVGGGLAAKHGILVRGGGEAFQEASDLDAIVFDKTGTLTEGGELKVTDHEILIPEEEQSVAWSIVQTLEEQSSHPIARAILTFASTQTSTAITTVSITEVPGLGVRGTFTVFHPSSTMPTTYEAALGSEALLSSLSSTPISNFASQRLSTWQSQCKSTAILALRIIATTESSSPSSSPFPKVPWLPTLLFATTDPLRPSALPTIHALQSLNLSIYLLSGDNPATARAVAASLSIPPSHVFAGVLPTEKAAKIHWLQTHAPRRSRASFLARLRALFGKQAAGGARAKIAFVGDGINDAPALLAADVSISLSTGSPIALSSSSFILLSPSLMTITTLLALSARVFRRIKFNFAWALVYNVVLVPVAAGVFFKLGGGSGWRLGPVWGSAAMAGSSVSVVGSSLLLRVEGGWWRWRGKERKEESGA